MTKARAKSQPKGFVVTNIGQLLTMAGAVLSRGRNIRSEHLGIIQDAALVIGPSKTKPVTMQVSWAGSRRDLPATFKKFKKINAEGRLVMPGFIDSHTHLVFAGDRSREFEMRLAGKTYAEIARAGGGIVNTTGATRAMPLKDLFTLSMERLQNFINQGVTTVEIKTGYGLSFEAEKKCLDVINQLKKKSPATVKATYLAAHAIPGEYKNKRSGYVEALTHDWLPKLKDKCDYVDMFIDAGYFDTNDAEVLFTQAGKLGLPVKVHADELKLTGGTETAARFHALSADHLLKIGKPQIAVLAGCETTATLLPTTAFFLKTGFAPARALLDAGARVALATDFNPGTSPTQDISVVGLLAALQMDMRIDEIIVALTLNGAYALGLQRNKGALLPGYDADFLMFEAESPAKIFYEFGQRPASIQVYCAGQPVNRR